MIETPADYRSFTFLMIYHLFYGVTLRKNFGSGFALQSFSFIALALHKEKRISTAIPYASKTIY
jgi:hypothetical protein